MNPAIWNTQGSTPSGPQFLDAHTQKHRAAGKLLVPGRQLANRTRQIHPVDRSSHRGIFPAKFAVPSPSAL